MTPEQWQRLDAVFEAASALPLAERDALVARACGDDAELAAEVRSLLAAASGAAARIRDAIGDAASRVVAIEAPGERRLGPYRLLGELGAGGMGAVYRAVRDDDAYRREVAVKVLHRGLESAQAVARFRDERQILATLDHPGIVRLLDGGSTPEGSPYLVMELVDGAPLTRFVAERELSLRARVALVRAVCAAVQYAHQRLVVHRDLKPMNILVTPDGQPKLLDFGIAKLLDESAGAREARTGTGMRVLTPEYASPEQVRGGAVTTASDVYALGLVLYEVVTGVSPQRGDAADPLAQALGVIERDPPRPSQVVAAAARRELADLDVVVMKALRKEPEERYRSVAALSEDLQRWLDGLPLAAHPPTWRYLARKLVRRHRVAVLAGVAALVALVVGAVVTIGQAARADLQAERAERRFADVRRLANTLLFEVDDEIKDVEGATGARALIVSRALEYLDGLAADASDDPGLVLELASAYVKIADIEGSLNAGNLGRPDDALVAYERARALLTSVLVADDASPTARPILAKALTGLALLHYDRGQPSLARAELGEVVAIQRSLRAEVAAAEGRATPRGGPDATDFLLALTNVVWIDRMDGDLDRCGALAAEAVETADAWQRDAPSRDARYWQGVARALVAHCASGVAEPEAGRAAIAEAVRLHEGIVAEAPENGVYAREVAFDLDVMALQYCSGGMGELWRPCEPDPAASEAALLRSTAIHARLAREDLNDVRAATEHLSSTYDLARWVARRDPREAVALVERVASETAGRIDASADRGDDYYYLDCQMAWMLAAIGRKDDARAALARGEKAAAGLGTPYEGPLWRATCAFEASRAHEALGERQAALEALDRSLAELRQLMAVRPLNIVPYVGAVATLQRRAELEPERRCELARAALATWRAWPGTATGYTRARSAELEGAITACGAPPSPIAPTAH